MNKDVAGISNRINTRLVLSLFLSYLNLEPFLIINYFLLILSSLFRYLTFELGYSTSMCFVSVPRALLFLSCSLITPSPPTTLCSSFSFLFCQFPSPSVCILPLSLNTSRPLACFFSKTCLTRSPFPHTYFKIQIVLSRFVKQLHLSSLPGKDTNYSCPLSNC